MLAAAAGCVGSELAQASRKRDSTLVASHRYRAAVLAGLQRVLPLTLVITFALVPSSATRIFGTFLCDEYQFSDPMQSTSGPSQHKTRRYLQSDRNLRCDGDDDDGYGDEYASTRAVAMAFVLVWPVGCVTCLECRLFPYTFVTVALAPLELVLLAGYLCCTLCSCIPAVMRTSKGAPPR